MPSMKPILLSLSLASVASAFVGTSPFVAWTDRADLSLPVSKSLLASNEVLKVLSSDVVCPATGEGSLKHVVLLLIEDLHASSLPSLSLPKSSLTVPYVKPVSGESEDILSAWEKLKSECADVEFRMASSSNADTSATWANMYIKKYTSSPSHLIILSSDPRSSHQSSDNEAPALRIQERAEQPLTTPYNLHPGAISVAAKNSTKHTVKGELLDRYTVLSAPLIGGLLVTFGIFFPILALGISALLSVSVPPRMIEVAKAPSDEKKRQ